MCFIIKKQLASVYDDSIEKINLKKGIYPFEKSPFSSGLINHNPSYNDLINIFGYYEHVTEILARTVSNVSNESSCIYIPNEKISNNDISMIIEKYNSQFNKESISHRKILQFGKYTFLAENEINTINLIRLINEYVNAINFSHYKEFAESQIKELNLEFQDSNKENSLKTLFTSGSIFCVYGSAGTGKSFFASYVLKVLKNLKTICIASTNPAVDNMKRKFADNSVQYMTITKYLKEFKIDSRIDLLIIDECSTISTKDMYNILNQTKPKLLLLLGDIFQIHSISFGNWFSILKEFIPCRCYIDLQTQFRTDSETLIDFWKEVRNIGQNIQEKLAVNQISHVFDDTVFKKNYPDEIILCLNYDGLYGINNINKILQIENKNKSYKWKQYIFKKDDPIIFHETYKYRDIFYNNLKGKIEKIDESQKSFIFTIRVCKILNPILCKSCGVELLSIDENMKESIVKFSFNKFTEDVYDKDTDGSIAFPFQVAYALSIHKAQGLEYDSVKLIISNEVEENITHSIFYTAITRARKNLTIYWTPETENKIVNSFKIQNYKNDANILKQRIKIINKSYTAEVINNK